MGMRFRRRLRLLPGVHLNVGLGGLSVSAGVRGASLTLGGQGVYSNLGLPGTGLSVRQRVVPPLSIALPRTAAGAQQAVPTQAVALQLSLGPDGRLQMASPDGVALPPRIEAKVRRDADAQLRRWLEDECNRLNEGAEQLAFIHRGVSKPAGETPFVPTQFADPAPTPPAPPQFGLWDRLWASRRRRKEDAFAVSLAAFETARTAWLAKQQVYDHEQARLRERSEVGRLEDPAIMEELIEEALRAISWPRETSVELEMRSDGGEIYIDVDLPEIEDMPRRVAEVARRGLKLNFDDRSEAQVRKLYSQHIHSVLLRVVGTCFATLPRLQTVVCSGYSQRVHPDTGRTEDDYLVSAAVKRETWDTAYAAGLERLDPAAFLAASELRRDVTATGIFRPIQPYHVAFGAVTSPAGSGLLADEGQKPDTFG